ncbi:hypothetical protein LOD99_1488 [Oopsacas minuta]|uniref:Uncharacterized protein n=1 Tax=Oopsacas minuta TaxID=111878 RepID=A0AAV7K675_9METZ|nr:hypothetical protein LOD99_1488 [Oopsacas minuta]
MPDASSIPVYSSPIDIQQESEQLALATSHSIKGIIGSMPGAHTIGTLNNTDSILNSSGSSFNMGIIETPIYSQEDSLNDDETVNARPSENQLIVYEIVNSGSQRGKPICIDCRGYSFTMKVWGKMLQDGLVQDEVHHTIARLQFPKLEINLYLDHIHILISHLEVS